MNALDGFFELPLIKQVVLLLGLSGSVALGIYIALWSRTPDYVPLYHQLNNKDSGDVVEALQRGNFQFKIDDKTGLVLVDSAKVQDARIKLAGQGIPNHATSGFEILDKDSMFGNSQLLERARYVRALEGELEKTITSIEHIKSARVHLGIPKQTSFLKDKRDPSASVFVDIYGGYKLDADQIAAISHLVASSVQGMSAQNVTVIDQNGKLLSASGSDSISAAAKQLDYTHKLEKNYAQRIQALLSPVLGYDRVKAEVTALVDFTSYEETSENYDPSKKAIRSEKISDVQKGSEVSAGIPGAQSNQPLTANQKPSQAAQPAQAQKPAEPQQVVNVNKNEVRNFELDRQIKHQMNLPGKIVRLSVAVVVDDKVSYDNAGKAKKTPLTPDEVKKIEGLVKDAIGFDEKRGDRVTVINSSFAPTEPVAQIPKEKFLDKPWFTSLTKQLLAAALVLALLLFVLRPIFKSLTNIASFKATLAKQLSSQDTSQILDSKGRKLSESEYQLRIKEIINEDPKKAAQVVKQWIGVDDGKG